MMVDLLPEDVSEFIRCATLELQRHASTTSEQKTALFQRAYKLYVKYDVEAFKWLPTHSAPSSDTAELPRG